MLEILIGAATIPTIIIGLYLRHELHVKQLDKEIKAKCH